MSRRAIKRKKQDFFGNCKCDGRAVGMNMITEYNDYCIICGRPRTDMHHIFKGNKQRRLATEDELLIPLCHEHHLGNISVHQTYELNVLCEIIGQLAFEKNLCAEGMSPENAREAFRIRYGRSYL